MEKTLTIRVAVEDLVAWKEAAWSERLSLSEWVRRRCDAGLAAGDSPMGRQGPEGVESTSPDPAQGSELSRAPAGRVPSAPAASSVFRPDPKVKK